MSTATAASPPRVAGPRPAAAGVARLSGRLVRRGALLAALATSGYLVIEVVSYQTTYPDAESRATVASFQDSPAVRMLQGIPHAVDTTGGFVAWDAGWMLGLGLAVWMLLATTRLLRGEEDAGRTELVLAAPVRATRAVTAQLLVLAAAVGLAGAAVTATMVAAGTGILSSTLFGLGMGGLAGTMAGVAAVAAQVLPVRRRAVAASAVALGLLFGLRMVANSADSRGWLRWLTPFGWLDELRPYGGDRWLALLPLLAAPVALAATAVALRNRRDTGGALLVESDRHRGHGRLLGSPLAFAWRSGQGVLLGWLVAVAAYGLVFGSLLSTVADFVARDEGYREVLEALGLDLARLTESLVGYLGGMMALVFALYACWRIGSARTEEASGRADNLLTRPVRRWRWLGGHAALALVGVVLLAAATGVGMWLGAVLTGAPVGLADALGSMLATTPAVTVFGGLAVLTLGLAPRVTVVVPVAATVVAYLGEMLGTALDWPAWALDLSPFHHLAAVPAEPFAPLAATVLAAVGAAATLLGLAAFQRRDLAGA